MDGADGLVICAAYWWLLLLPVRFLQSSGIPAAFQHPCSRVPVHWNENGVPLERRWNYIARSSEGIDASAAARRSPTLPSARRRDGFAWPSCWSGHLQLTAHHPALCNIQLIYIAVVLVMLT
jgi:hypothetical protein